MKKLRHSLLETVLYPFLCAILPHRLQVLLARHVEQHEGLYAEHIQAMQNGLSRHLPDADLSQAGRELRFIHLMDHRDVFLTALRFKNGLISCDIQGRLPRAGSLILGAHRANAWWVLPLLASHGTPTHFVSAPLVHPPGWKGKFFKPYRLLRWRLLNRIGGRPVIPMRGATHACRAALLQSENVMALIDLPTSVVKQAQAILFLGHTAYMPRRLIDTAIAAGASVYYCRSGYDAADLRFRLEFIDLSALLEADKIFHEYARLLEQDIRANPGSWHSWGHIDHFFKKPSSPSV